MSHEWFQTQERWWLKRLSDGRIVEEVRWVTENIWAWGDGKYDGPEAAKRAAQHHTENPTPKGRS